MYSIIMSSTWLCWNSVSQNLLVYSDCQKHQPLPHMVEEVREHRGADGSPTPWPAHLLALSLLSALWPSSEPSSYHQTFCLKLTEAIVMLTLPPSTDFYTSPLCRVIPAAGCAWHSDFPAGFSSFTSTKVGWWLFCDLSNPLFSPVLPQTLPHLCKVHFL